MDIRHESTAEFIKVYRSLPALWDTSSEEYSNRTLRNNAYMELLRSYQVYDKNATRETLVKKINSLRTTFRKEYKKVKQSMLSRASEDEIHKPTLWYFKDLMFLVDQDTLDKSELDTQESFCEITYNYKHESDSNYGAVTEIEKPVEFEQPTRPAVKKLKFKPIEKVAQDIIYSLADQHINKKEDEFSIMSKAYSEKLKKMQPMQLIYADRLIHEVLFEGLLGNLGRNSSININHPISSHNSISRSPMFVDVDQANESILPVLNSTNSFKQEPI